MGKTRALNAVFVISATSKQFNDSVKGEAVFLQWLTNPNVP